MTSPALLEPERSNDTVEPAPAPTVSRETLPRWRRFVNSLIGAEISSLTRYYDRLVQLLPRPADSGALLQAVECPVRQRCERLESMEDCSYETDSRTAVLLNGNLNHEHDIEGLLASVGRRLSRSGRIIAVLYNPYLRWLYRLANWFGIREGEQPSTFVTHTDLATLAKLSGFEVVRVRPVAYLPFELFGIGTAINRIMPAIPLLRWLCLATVVVLRPVKPSSKRPSLSVIIPARNERGNIENALKRMPDFGAPLEVVFVEGHSNDETWEEIQRVIPLYSDRFVISAYKQEGRGKSDAVRLGFTKARNEIVTILDADLTMPPELLGRFFDAYCGGLGDFINGNRLVYPMEGQAMKFLNELGNVFFAKALSVVLGARLGDSLCGTKLLSRKDYERMCAWRADFGDFDPFGDFELLFPAAILGLGIVDIPIRYRDRVYGSTNIRRFYHGWMLLKMTAIGFIRVLVGPRPALPRQPSLRRLK